MQEFPQGRLLLLWRIGLFFDKMTKERMCRLMCLGIPGKITSMGNGKAVAEIMGVSREISVELLKDVKIGDFVLIHAGCAIQIIDREEAEATIQLFSELKDVMND